MSKQYTISIDWLSVSCELTTDFCSEAEQTATYNLANPGYGAKFWKQLRKITRREDGREIGVLCWQPTTQGVNPYLAVIKFDNELLYDSDCFEVITHCILELGLRFHGISRIDIAADFNCFNHNLHPQQLMQGYYSNKYLKGGASKYMIVGHHNYFAAGRDSAQLWSSRPILDQEQRARMEAEREARNKELLAHGMPTIPADTPKRLTGTLDLQPHTIESFTWGNRSSGVQVQLYNKTREMQQKSPKWYIVKTWDNAGLDISKDVWRLEFRINNRGKELVNTVTGQPFNLSLIDILIQEQVESLFFAYLDKYFRFYYNDGHEKLANCKRMQLLVSEFKPIAKPKQYSRVAKSFTRTTKLIVREIERHRLENESFGNTEVAALLSQVRGYFSESYRLGRWLEEQDVQTKLETGELQALEPKFIPQDRRYFGRDGLRAVSVARATDLEAHIRRIMDAPAPPPDDDQVYSVDWDALSVGEQNIFAIFAPRDAVPMVEHVP